MNEQYEANHQPSQPVSDYISNIEPLQKQKKKRATRAIIALLTLIVGLSAAGFVFMSNRIPPPPRPQEHASEASEQPKKTITTETKRYSSAQFAMDFDLPADWDVKDEPASGVLVASSPNVSIPAAGGGFITGRVVLSVRDKKQKLPEFDEGNAVAVLDSEKITYTKPSAAQRGQTHVSFLAYPASATQALIDGIYITGDFGYQKDQAIPKIDIQKIDPVISISFKACDGTCTKDFGISPEAWTSGEFGGALKRIMTSITVN